MEISQPAATLDIISPRDGDTIQSNTITVNGRGTYETILGPADEVIASSFPSRVRMSNAKGSVGRLRTNVQLA